MDKSTETLVVSHHSSPTKLESPDWNIFTERLASVLSQLKEDQFLIVSTKKGNGYAQFACQGAWGMRVEVPSNQFLKGDDRLNHRQMSWLRSHGWNAPTGKPNKATSKKDPHGSPNWFIDFPAPISAGRTSQMATEALVNGLEVSHPGWLQYEAFDANRQTLLFEELGLKPIPKLSPPLMESALQVVRKVTGIADLELDEDGDITVRYGPIVLCTTQVEKKLRLSTRIVSGIVESPELLIKLNELNAGLRGIRCVYHKERVYAVLDLPANPFVPEHLSEELSEFVSTAGELAFMLRAEFVGDGSVKTSPAANYIQ